MWDAKNVSIGFKRAIEEAKKYLDSLDEARNEALKIARDIIRLSGYAVNRINNLEFNEASRIIAELDSVVKSYLEIIKPYKELFYAGFTLNALSEYVEAKVLYEVFTRNRVPTHEELNVHPTHYVLGASDCIGEFKRIILELIRRGELSKCWVILEYMETLYSSISILDYPDPLAPGLKHKIDVARKIIDSTKELLLDLSSRSKLESKLEKLIEKLL